MKKSNLWLLLTVMCVMCKQKQYDGNEVFVDFDNSERVSLFDYFSRIELIPLETSSEVLVAGIRKIILHHDIYYVLDPRQSIIFVFDLSGKFLFKINKRGTGPGEYSSIGDININPFTKNLELLEPHGLVHSYDLAGNYIETKRITYPDFSAVSMFTAIENNIHVFYAQFQPQKIIYFNLEENRLLHEEFEESERLGFYGVNSVYQFQNDWYFFRPVHPVVYKIEKEGLDAAFKFDFGQYTREGTTATFSEETNYSRDKLLEEIFAQFPYVLTTVRHNDKYVLATLLWRDATRRANIIHDKSTGKSKFILDFTEQVEFRPDNGGVLIVTDEYVMIVSQWVDLEDRITKDMLDDKNKEIFEELMQAQTELNPVLIKYWFK